MTAIVIIIIAINLPQSKHKMTKEKASVCMYIPQTLSHQSVVVGLGPHNQSNHYCHLHPSHNSQSGNAMKLNYCSHR